MKVVLITFNSKNNKEHWIIVKTIPNPKLNRPLNPKFLNRNK